MKLPEFVKALSEILATDPNAKNLQVVASTDDEGNWYHPVIYSPTLGVFTKCNGTFEDYNTDDPEDENNYTDEDVNAICVN